MPASSPRIIYYWDHGHEDDDKPVTKVEITQRVRFAAALAIVMAILVAGGLLLKKQEANTTSDEPVRAFSNIYPSDYVGPEACSNCHLKNYELWRTHPHSKMNRNAGDGTVVGDFSGTKIAYDGGTVVFDRIDGDFAMTLSRRGAVHRFRVTRTIGSRFQQMYIGVLVEGPDSFDALIEAGTEVKLPFGYWIKRKQWLPFTYLEGDGPRPEYTSTGERTPFDDMYDPRGFGRWDQTCIWCHNTYPYVQRLQNGKLVGFPKEEISLKSLTAEQPSRLRHSPRLPPSELITLGISCETCHFGGREHALEERKVRFLPSGDDVDFPKATTELIATARESPYVINSICHQCHRANGSLYPGRASIDNSAEVPDLLSGGCASEIKCTDCHNPHKPGPTVRNAPDRREHIEACLRCHEKYRAEDAAEAHTRHSSESQVSCLDCHMPRIVNGLANVIRTHQISSPTNERMFGAAAPNACNLCHLDRSTLWTLASLETLWGLKVEPSEKWKPRYGGLDGPTGIAWLRHSHPIVRRVAADAYARSPLGEATLPWILSILNDTYATNRMFGLLAIERIVGRRLGESEYSPMASPSVRVEQVAALREALTGAVTK